ncbi:MAG: Uma2 family endonuclease [Planctomycetota bacterium]|nr:MAG: Uma2 family endonuclease [Planctomycetota bacterium]
MATISSGIAAGAGGSFPLPHSWTLGDLQRHLGGIPADRVRLYPLPGTGLPDDADQTQASGPGLCELVDGVLVEKVMGTLESLVAMEVAFALRTWLDLHPLGVVLGADGLLQLGPQLVRGPDVSFLRWERFPGRRLPVERVWAVAPDLAVEVLSPGNTPAEMERKVADYLGAGARLVWIIDPPTRTAVAHTAGAPGNPSPTVIDATGELHGGDVLPGFTLKLATIFRGQGR